MINFKAIKTKIQSLMPRYWLSNHECINIWDKKLNEYLDDPNTTIERYDDYEAIINGMILVWVRNYPYAYGSFSGYVGVTHKTRQLPSNTTRIRLYERMKTATIYIKKRSI